MAEKIGVILDASMDISNVLGSVRALQGAFSGLKLPSNLTGNVLKDFDKLEQALKKYKDIQSKDIVSKNDIKTLNQLQKTIDSTFGHLIGEIETVSGHKIILEADATKIKEAEKVIQNLQAQIKDKIGKVNLDFNLGSKNKPDIVGINLNSFITQLDSATGKSKTLKATMEGIKESLASGNTANLGAELLGAINQAQRLKGAGKDVLQVFSQMGLIKLDTKQLDDAAYRAKKFEQALKIISPELQKLGIDVGDLKDKLRTAFEVKTDALTTGVRNGVNALNDMTSSLQTNRNTAREVTTAYQSMAQQTERARAEVQQLQQTTQYFFSLRNMLNLFKRGIKEAVNTVKELDAAMTETAVVTKYSVSDMWAKLPEYTANANALGATVQDMYESTTLYYQQGLDTQQAMSIATETMKMARIAGMEAADATDMMTAALRGFNMELNETSAERINDVYSNLAAKTASNTQELGTAMQRTASIAHSAGMSFEGTAAFLAQAIETTREPAENLGTAMKTIVARFQELKKNPLEIAEVDGEEVSYNKVDDALKTIGVDLKDANGQFRDLDQVFLDISQKWDGLTQTQQRYIATTAAGSRQQSRFIAMMSNYDRTMELMGYANDSAGASTTQFNKTLESLEAKLNKFQNAWKQFLMGIMNDTWTKRLVDAGTTVLNTVNKIIDALSFNGKAGLLKSALSTFTAFTALKIAGRGANTLIGGLGGMIDPQSSITAGLRTGALGGRQAANAAQAQMIYQPIVNELRAIRQLKGQELTQENKAILGPYDQLNKFKAARTELTNMGNKGTIGDLKQQLSGLSNRNQNLLMSGNAGIFRAATNSIIDKYGINNRKEVRRGERFLNDQRKSAQITAEEYYNALQDPNLLKQAMIKAGVQKDNPAYQYIDSLDKGVTAQADQMAGVAKEKVLKSLQWTAENKYGLGTDEYYKALEESTNRVNKAFESDKAKQYFRGKALENEGFGSSKTTFEVSKWGKALDGIGKLGTGISQVGMGIQAFGGLLVSSANPALQMFGTALTSVGGLLSGLGMSISGISSGFTALASSTLMENVASKIVTAAKGSEAIASLGVAGVATALTGGLLALVAILGIAVAAHKKYIENIKKDAEEVTKNYQEKSSANQSNISNLKQWKAELAVLSQGVDENGLNVSLDTSDYDRYLEIVDGIAKINPEIVKGYNAQGHAIIDNNKALEETLALEEKRSKDILKDYTSDDSLNKLIKARNLERRQFAGGGNGDRYVQQIPYELKPRTSMRQEMSKIGSELRRNKDLIDLSKLGINIDALAAGSEAEFSKVLNNYDTFKQLVSNSIDSAGDQWSEKSQEAIEKSFSAFEEAGGELDELVQPVYDALSAKASQTAGFKEMENSLKTPFQNALKDLATNAEFNSGKEIGEAAKSMATKFASYNDIYLDAMDEVEKANEQFALDLSEEQYDLNTKNAIDKLNELKANLEDTPEGHAISEWVDNEIAKIENHLSGGAKTIEEAWDTISDKVAVAESALEDFNKATEKDYYSAAEDMQKIFDTVMDEDAYHAYGSGDQTFWKGAEKLLGTENIMDKTKDEVYGMMKNVEPFLKEGPEGVQNFANKVEGLSTELDKIAGVDMEDGWFKSIDENVNPDAWAEIAKTLGISEELLTSLINKARQFKELDFSDMPAVRAAYAADDTVIHGTQKVSIAQKDENGKAVQAEKLFITDAELRSRMGTDYYSQEKREAKKDALAKQGIDVLPEHLKDLETSLMKNEMGIKDMTGAIETFGATGAFDKNEIKDAAEAIERERLGKDFDKEAFEKDFGENWFSYLENMEYPTLQPLQTIEGYVAAIANNIANQNIKKGTLTNRQSDELEQAVYGKRGVDDSLANYFRLGQDAQGNKLSKYTYEKSLNELLDLRTQGQSYLDALKEGRKYATGEDQARYDDEIQRTTKALQSLDNAIESGKKKWDEFNNQETPETPESDTTTGQSETGTSTGETWERAQDRTGYNPFPVEIIKDSTSSGTSTDDSGWSRKDGGEGFQTSTSGGSDGATIVDSATTASNTINESGQSLSTAATELSNSASQLTNAATTLSAAALMLGKNPPNGTSAPTETQGPPTPTTATNNTNASVVLDAASATQVLNDLNAKVDEVYGKIETGATFKIGVEDSGLSKAGESAAKITKAASGNNNIQVSAGEVDLSSVDTAKQKIAQDKAELPVKAKDDTAAGLQAIKNKIKNTSASVTIKATSATSNITVTVKGNAKGQNNYIKHSSLPLLGSLAKGTKSRFGQLGPRGNGGLTLTGEEGYEIAWLPNENRSMILGANGPQMLNLPSNAVVWTHEQSKKILKQKSIPAGSHGGPSKTTMTSSGGWNFRAPGSYTSSTVTKAAQDVKKDVKGTGKEVEKAAKDTADKIARVIVWWENAARRAEGVQHMMDNNQRIFEKYLKNIQASSSGAGTTGKGNDYINSINQYIGEQQQQLDKATDELRQISTGKWQSGELKGKEATSKKTKKKKKNQIAYEQGADNIVEVSYEGKNKKGKKTTKTAYMNTAGYVYWDESTQSYQIDQQKLNSNIKNVKQRKAFADQLNKEINDRNSKKYNAEDAIQKAQEALEKMGEELYETFHSWEIELTKIWEITKEIERTEALIARNESFTSLLSAQLGTGLRQLGDDTKDLDLALFNDKLNSQTQLLYER